MTTELKCEWTQVGPHGSWPATMPVWAVMQLAHIREMMADGRWGGVGPSGPVLTGHLLAAGDLLDGEELINPGSDEPVLYQCTITNNDGTVGEYCLWRDLWTN